MANIEEEIATESFPQILTERENRSRDDEYRILIKNLILDL